MDIYAPLAGTRDTFQEYIRTNLHAAAQSQRRQAIAIARRWVLDSLLALCKRAHPTLSMMQRMPHSSLARRPSVPALLLRARFCCLDNDIVPM